MFLRSPGGASVRACARLSGQWRMERPRRVCGVGQRRWALSTITSLLLHVHFLCLAWHRALAMDPEKTLTFCLGLKAEEVMRRTAFSFDVNIAASSWARSAEQHASLWYAQLLTNSGLRCPAVFSFLHFEWLYLFPPSLFDVFLEEKRCICCIITLPSGVVWIVIVI